MRAFDEVSRRTISERGFDDDDDVMLWVVYNHSPVAGPRPTGQWKMRCNGAIAKWGHCNSPWRILSVYRCNLFGIALQTQFAHRFADVLLPVHRFQVWVLFAVFELSPLQRRPNQSQRRSGQNVVLENVHVSGVDFMFLHHATDVDMFILYVVVFAMLVLYVVFRLWVRVPRGYPAASSRMNV